MSNMNQGGLTVSVPLFFNEDSSIDFITLKRYLKDVCENKKVSAIYSMAYNTRYRMLSDNELLNVNIFIIEFCNSFNIDVYVGHPYSFNQKSLMSYFEKISELKVEGVSMLYPERYFNNDEIIIDFLKIPNEFGLKTVLHEMKLTSGFDGELMNWPKRLLERALREANITAVKEDSKDDKTTQIVLSLCKEHDAAFILAGGGKRRVLDFLEQGITTWLNGSTMFLPKSIDDIYSGFIDLDRPFIQKYLHEIEDPFFKQVVNKFGWHLSHKAALQYFGYGKRYERFPHAVMGDSEYTQACEIFMNISKSNLI